MLWWTIRKVSKGDLGRGEFLEAIDKLGESKSRRAIKPLLEVIKDDNIGDVVRESALHAFNRVREALGGLYIALSESWESRRAGTRDPLAEDPAVVEALAAACKSKDKKELAFAKKLLSWIGGPQAVECLLSIYKKEKQQKDYEGLKITIDALGNVLPPDERTATALSDSYYSKRYDLFRNLTINALLMLAGHSEKALKTVLDALKQDEDYYIRSDVANGLRLKDERVVEALIAALNDSDLFVRANAAQSLRFLDEPRAIKPLIKCFKQKEWWGAGEAPTALDMLLQSIHLLCRSHGDEQLRAALNNEDKSVRLGAKKARDWGKF